MNTIDNVPNIYRVIISEDMDNDAKDFWSYEKALNFFNDQTIIEDRFLQLIELKPSSNGSWVFLKTLKTYKS